MGILWYIIIFCLKQGTFSQIGFFKKINFFLIFFFQKISKKKFWYKKFFWKKLICEKTPSLSKKMMIYHKMPMSGVYENVFQTSEISILPSLSNELLFTLCLHTPSRISYKSWNFRVKIYRGWCKKNRTHSFWYSVLVIDITKIPFNAQFFVACEVTFVNC